MKVNILLAYLSAIILTFFSLKGHAQAYTDVTYHFEPEILNQFTVMETGAGALGEGSPLAVEWYTHMHKGYMAYAYMPTSSKLVNREVFRRKTQEEVKYAARVDSDAVHRGKQEAKNIIDRTPGATDAAWLCEKSKIEGMQYKFMANINKIVQFGGTHSLYMDWRTIYYCIDDAIKATRKAYMSSGQRKKEYLAIYHDLVKRNGDLCSMLYKLYSLKQGKKLIKEASKPKKNRSTKVIAYDCLNDWQSKFATNVMSSKD